MNIISTYSVYSFSFSVAVDAAFIIKSNDYGNHDTPSAMTSTTTTNNKREALMAAAKMHRRQQG